ncbi:hypothetical protein DPMN_113006 [Dreissena polymorpha]|uniref:Uncharacterized protein n=1 Tax=Dreissena polymorpha TaxID=45954 RepID=A0A9D4KHG7_DREPO|nr:hypothetical protein DPMN_113006 [Dreissena polymorpha]
MERKKPEHSEVHSTRNRNSAARAAPFNININTQLLLNTFHASTVPFSLDVIPLASARELTVSVKLLATSSVKLLASEKPLALRHPKALGEASVTALYNVGRLQPSQDPLTIQQILRSPGSTVRSQARIKW